MLAIAVKLISASGWIDWPWQPWLEEQFKHTEAVITPEQREVWRIHYDWMTEKEPPPPPPPPPVDDWID